MKNDQAVVPTEKTLLDEFAQTALLGILTSKTIEIKPYEFAAYATRSYELAKEMIKAKHVAEQTALSGQG